jgi:hypothetical protein
MCRDEQYNLRFLPHSGGLMEQDGLLMDVFSVIRNEFVTAHNQRVKRGNKQK